LHFEQRILLITSLSLASHPAIAERLRVTTARMAAAALNEDQVLAKFVA
jgi:hypothetical protein